MPRSLRTIAFEINRNWKRIHYTAFPYLNAMYSLNTITESHGCDSGRSIVLYFLCNASTWKGETARRIKAELKQMLK